MQVFDLRFMNETTKWNEWNELEARRSPSARGPWPRLGGRVEDLGQDPARRGHGPRAILCTCMPAFPNLHLSQCTTMHTEPMHNNALRTLNKKDTAPTQTTVQTLFDHSKKGQHLTTNSMINMILMMMEIGSKHFSGVTGSGQPLAIQCERATA